MIEMIQIVLRWIKVIIIMNSPFLKMLILISYGEQPSKTVHLRSSLFCIIIVLVNLVSLTFNLSQNVQTLRGW